MRAEGGNFPSDFQNLLILYWFLVCVKIFVQRKNVLSKTSTAVYGYMDVKIRGVIRSQHGNKFVHHDHNHYTKWLDVSIYILILKTQ